MTVTQTQFERAVDRSSNPFKQDIVGSNSITISAGVEERFVIDGLGRNYSTGPSYMTDRYNTSTNVMTAVTEVDSPVYVATVGFVWTPSASAEGEMKIRVYINDTTPKLIGTYTKSYKGSDPIPKNIITTWYWGSDTGYDAKNDGAYFTIEFEHAGTITVPSLLIYNTQ